MAVTADWNPLGDVFYRKYELYSLDWFEKVDLQKYMVAAAPYGGPVALMRDDRKLLKVASTIPPIVYIYSSAGKEISAFKWNSGNVIKMGWSCTEHLLCVQDNGSILVYDIFGTFLKVISMGSEAKDVKVIDCQIFNSFNGTGVAVITSAYRVFVITNIHSEDPRPRRLAEVPGIDAPPGCWTMLNQDRQCRALVTRENELFLLDYTGQCEKQSPPITVHVEEFIEMAVSFNHKYLALFTNTGMLWIGSSDLKKVYCEFDTKCPTRPQQLVWCGTGAIVGYWENILLMVGPQKDWVKYSYDTPIHLVAEIDSLRIIGHFQHEMLQRVPEVVEEIFKIGSMSPGAMLYEAHKEFQRQSQKSDEYIRMIQDKLDVAVEQCVDAAAQEFEPANQKALLRAASFGKCFLTDYQSDKFVNTCQLLRVLSNVRDYRLGIPITYSQLDHLKLPVLLDRLVLRREYCLAIRICQYLKVPDSEGASRIVAHWACYKVQQKSVDDEQLARDIAKQLGDIPGVSYSEIANKAIECGRRELAINLLNFEPRASEQVPLLLKMNSNETALSKAIDSGDTDLVYTVILQLKENLPLSNLSMVIRNMPVAHSLFLQYCRNQKREMLQKMFYQEDNFLENANCRIMDSFDEDRLEARLTHLEAAQDAYGKARNEWAAKQTEEEIRLLRRQRDLEAEFNTPFLDMSLHRMIHKLTVDNKHRHAEQLKKDFKVPDRRYWWIRIQALAEMGDWAELEKFSKVKKSPIGYEPFVEVCVKHNSQQEASKYLPKVVPENRVKCLIKMGSLEQAADLAFQQKSRDDLDLVLHKCTTSNKTLAERVQSLKAQLGSK